VKSVAERVFARISDVSASPTVVTIGAFDGVHRGHQHLLRLAREGAKEHDSRLLVLTFEALPIQVLRPKDFVGRVLTNERRRELLFRHGADAVVELPFTLEMSRLCPEEFMAHLFAVGPVHQIWVGSDFALGHKRSGNPERLAEIAALFGGVVRTVPRVDYKGREVSSTRIRRLILEGRPEDASLLLGHRFQVSGEVIRGAQIGRTIGFPTANVVPPRDLVPLQDGIYATFARIAGHGTVFEAMTYIGTRPAVNTGDRMIETHLFKFDGDIYGRTLETEFVCRLRPDANFPSVDVLKAQLARDEEHAREMLTSRRPGEVEDS
jgi:riboflavin kinase/FMN adenylyltransferase